MSELVIVLATYNEAGNLAPLVEALQHLREDLHLLVVDDNSPDGTQQVAQELSASFGNVTVIARPRKMGLGSALLDGLKAALGHRRPVCHDHGRRPLPRPPGCTPLAEGHTQR